MKHALSSQGAASAPLDVLRKYFGYDSFRPGQEAIIRAILEGRDTLAVMPTGGGKSICYQIPAIMFPGLTIVVSPLISLMADQTAALRARHIPADYLASVRTRAENLEVLGRARSGQLKLLYVSPERLEAKSFIRALTGVAVSFLCVDEAHCISEWGQEFRPSYARIPAFFKETPPVTAAFTATATPEVARDIIRKLSLKDPFRTAALFDRPNLFFEVRHPANKWQELLAFLSSHKNECGVIYCRTRVTTETLARRLARYGWPALPYHGGMEAEKRHANEAAWLKGCCPLMVATNAFGMGIDKPDVRFVVHYQMPGDMESYYQEAGRAGRDGRESVCVLLASDRDLALNRFFIRMVSDKALREEKERQFMYMRHFSAGSSCLRGMILGYFGEKAPSRCGKCSFCAGISTFASAVPEGREDLRLYRELVALRHRVAKEKGVLPWKIFPDQALHDLARKRPERMWDMVTIEGIGWYSCIKNGAAFLREISAWNQSHPVIPPS